MCILIISNFLSLQDPMNTIYGSMFTRPETCLPWTKIVSQVSEPLSDFLLFFMLIKSFFCNSPDFYWFDYRSICACVILTHEPNHRNSQVHLEPNLGSNSYFQQSANLWGSSNSCPQPTSSCAGDIRQ